MVKANSVKVEIVGGDVVVNFELPGGSQFPVGMDGFVALDVCVGILTAQRALGVKTMKELTRMIGELESEKDKKGA